MITRYIEFDDLEKISELYCSVFSMPPWNEPWTIENSKHRLEHIFVSKGFVGLLIEENKVLLKQS